MEVLSASLVVRISKTTGKDSSSCWISNATTPCRTMVYALGALWDTKNYNETLFTFSIEDQVYSLEERVNITQTSAEKSVYLQSSNTTGRSVIHCGDSSAGIEIGTPSINAGKTRNIYFQNLEFQNCGPRFAAVVFVWNSENINFTNCMFKHNNQAGINAFDSGVAIESCHFFNNTSNGNSSSQRYTEGLPSSGGGGAGFLFYNAKNLSLTVRNSIFDSNSAVMNEAACPIVSSYNVSQIIPGGGGLLVVFTGKAVHCQVEIENTLFSNNNATLGGGLYLEQSHTAIRNKCTVTNSNFTGNKAGENGGGLFFSQWDNASSFITIFKNCIVSDNKSRRGAGMIVFFMNKNVTPSESVLR